MGNRSSILEKKIEPQSRLEFDFVPLTRILFGRGKVRALGQTAKSLGFRRVLLVSDPEIVRVGHVGSALDSLRDAGIQTCVFDGVEENPTTSVIERGLEIAQREAIDSIIGIGGGSSMDCAKGINFLLTNGGRMEDYWGVGKATKPMLPMIAVPTTAGTGSEAQSFALIADPVTHQKMACGDKKASCKVAILDPELTLSLPLEVTAATGIDALSHAVESYVTTRRNPISQAFARQAWQLLSLGFEKVIRHPDDLEARGQMSMGACLAGMAIENSMLGAAHSLANPLTAHHGIPHGVAIGLMLPHVVRFNGEVCNGDYSDLASGERHRGEGHSGDGHSEEGLRGAERVASRIEFLRELAGLPSSLQKSGIDESQVAELSSEAARQWTAQFNPRAVSARELEELYRCAL